MTTSDRGEASTLVVLALGLIVVPAAFFDVQNDGVDLGDVALIGAVIAAIFAGARWIRRALRKEITEVVEKRTAQIQPPTIPPGKGHTLEDIAKQVAEVRNRQDADADKNRADHTNMRRDIGAFMFAIGAALQIPPEERLEFWKGVTQAYGEGSLASRFPGEE